MPQKIRIDRVGLAFLAGTIGAFGSARTASGQTLTWLNAAGGSIGTAANWNPAQVPGAGSTLLFNLAAAYPLTFPAGVPASANLTFARGTQTLTINSPHTTNLVTIGSVNAAAGTVNLTTGRLNTGDVRIGSAFGTTGTLNVNDDDALLDCSLLSVADSTNLTGSVNVTNSGRIEASSVVIGNDNPSSVGTMTVNGRTQVFPVLQSEVITSGSFTVGRDGEGNLNVLNGASVQVGTSMTIAQNVSAGPILSEGNVTIGGAGLGFPAVLSVGSTLRIGRGTTAGSDAGNGAMTVNDDGRVHVSGSTTVGGSGLGSGVLTVNTGGVFETAGLTFGTSGDFQHLGGRVTVVGGGFTHDEPTLTVSGAVDTSLVLDGLTTPATFAAGTVGNDAITVGNSGVGSLTLRNGSVLTVPLGEVTLGSGGGASGTLMIESGASMDLGDDGDILVGGEGAGTLTIRSGGEVDCGGIIVSSQSGAGTVLIENPGTSVRLDATSVRSGGAMTIRDGAVMTLDGQFESQVPVHAGASLTIDNATINATTDVSIDGTFTMTNGVINAREFKRTVPVSASGTINAIIDSGPSITATGDLVLGDGGVQGFHSTDLVVGPHRVELRDSGTATLRITTIAGGELITPSLFRIPPGTSLTGSGTLHGDVVNLGTISATGSNGLRFSGIVTGVGQGIGGTKITFADGGGFNGVGTIGAKVQNDVGARLTFTAASTIGDGTTFGFTGGGELDITGGLTINDSNGVNLGSRTTLRNAVLSCPSTINVDNGGEIRGVGAVVGRLECSGTISPGIPGGDETSQITVNGNYFQFNGVNLGTLVIDLEGSDPTQADLLFVNGGSADLRGTIQVRRRGGFNPVNGFQRVIVLANSIAFNPTTIIVPPQFHLEATPTSVKVVYCSADFNSDGFVDFFDYDAYVECFEGGACPAGTTADFNGDGFADFFDYDEFVVAFEGGC